MSRVKLAILLCFVVVGASSLTATVASAGEWDVNGKPLVGSAAVANPIKVLEGGSLTAAGETIECVSTELGVSAGELVAPDGLKAADLTFKGCTARSPCALATETLLSLSVHGLAELDGTLGTFIKVLPLPSKTFMVFKLEGESCALVGTQPVTGSLDVLLPSGRDPGVLQLANIFSLPGSLKIGSSEASLAGSFGHAQLASKVPWGFL